MGELSCEHFNVQRMVHLYWDINCVKQQQKDHEAFFAILRRNNFIHCFVNKCFNESQFPCMRESPIHIERLLLHCKMTRKPHVLLYLLMLMNLSDWSIETQTFSGSMYNGVLKRETQFFFPISILFS